MTAVQAEESVMHAGGNGRHLCLKTDGHRNNRSMSRYRSRVVLIMMLLLLVLPLLAPSAMVLPGSPAVCAADQILEIDSSSLTTYLESSTTNVQDVRPLVTQRGVNIDGSIRLRGGPGMALAGNPFGDGPGWTGNRMLNGMVELNDGTYTITEVDLALPSTGLNWVVGRSYNARQLYSSSHHDSSGYQGKNWFQLSQPEILLYEDGEDNADDVLYLVYGADRFIEFKRKATNAEVFKAKNGAAGAVLYEEGATNEPDTYTYTDQHGNEFVFFGFDADASPCEGQFWKMTDPDSNTAFVGDASTGSTAISNGYNGSGEIEYAYDASDRRYSYTYTSGYLTEVKAEIKTGGTWASPTGVTEVGKVEYAYYGAETYGDAGDLKTVTITTPLTDSGQSSVREKYYRYWEGTFNASTNPGHPHGIQYVYDFEGIRNFDWTGDSTFDDDYLTATENSLKPYASVYFEYDSSHRIVEVWFNGECGCSGAGDGAHTLEYESNGSYTDNSGYDSTPWCTRTTVQRPSTKDASNNTVQSWFVQYFDEAGQAISKVRTDGDPDNTGPAPSKWATQIVRDSAGCITEVRMPDNNNGYTHSSGSITESTSSGLIWLYNRVSSGNWTGFRTYRKFQEDGTSGLEYYADLVEYDEDYITVTDGTNSVTLVRPHLDGMTKYTTKNTAVTSGPASAVLVTEYSSTLAPETSVTTNPTVSSGENGSGSATSRSVHYDEDGTVDFTKSEEGIIGYQEYTNGQVTKSIQDADTGKTGSGEDFENVSIPTGFGSTGTEAHRKTTYVYDNQARRTTTTLPDGRVTMLYYTQLADRRLVTLSYPKFVDGTPDTYYGPVSYSVTNHAGRSEFSGTVSLSGGSATTTLTGHVDETDSDPILAMDLGTVVRMATSIYDESGTKLEESRAYFDIPASGAGTDGTNYDATTYAYDDQGNKWRTKSPTGTISRAFQDSLGRGTSSYIGTNDSSFTGGEASGTHNMVKTSAVVYDSGNDDGNSYVTSRTAYVEDGDTDKRETTFTNNDRGWTVVSNNGNAPYPVNLYDNQGRVIATGLYSSSGSLSASTDPTSTTTNRVGLSETSYDKMGRVYETVHSAIDPSDGSVSDTLTTDNWYDAAGRLIKTDGSQLTKTFYDRLGRTTHQFTLARMDDTGYTDADDVTGDIVLVEQQTSYESTDSDNVLMSATISRHHDDHGPSGETTGALDTNADTDDLKYTAANVAGRIQIMAMWYDNLDRQTDVVAFGTYGGSDFDRDGLSAPARSDTALRSTYSYADDGTVQDVTDPMGIVTRTSYDDAGRTTAVIRNYVNGTPSGTYGDDDLYTRYEYTDGLQTKVWVDIDGDDTEDAADQVTEYDYGTTKGASAGDSEIATGHLLQEVTYPDSGGATDTVTYAYNAQSQQIWTEDQSANVIETDFDTAGRETHRRITTLDADFDGDVRRITMAYDSLGRISTVTQYDNATVGSGSVVDQVQYTYDDWGNIEKFEQDRNSAVTGGETTGAYGYYDVDYTYEKATTGRNTVRRTTMDLPNGDTVTYEYTDTSGWHYNDVSRPRIVKLDTTVVAVYAYNGLAELVGTYYSEPDVFSYVFDPADTDSFRDLDRFNRVTTSRWTADLATDVDFYNVDITYDRNSGITLIEDNVHAGFDVDYTNDDLGRLQKAEEGTWGGSSISSRTRQQIWDDGAGTLGLDQLGNWGRTRLDLDGDNAFAGTGEYDDDRTHNIFNELTGRDTDDNGSDDYTLTYDEVGNLTDDGENYEYEYDPFGRLRKISDTSDQSLVAEYKYNGLGYRISAHQDTDTDGDVDANDQWYHFAYDDNWRIVATFREDDTSPKEQFVYHNAGLDGMGGSSYIDSVILRDKDASTGWTSQADALDEVRYYCQNWRADVSAIVTSGGYMVEWAKYSPYGIPFGLPGADTDSDGDCDATDITQIQTWIDAGGGAYDVRGDVDLDGDVDATDKSIAQSNYQGTTSGWNDLTAVGNRKGYAGYEYEFDNAIPLYHVRHRVLHTVLGRWTRRDPLGFVDGMNVYEYVGGRVLEGCDDTGLSRAIRSSTLDCCDVGFQMYLEIDPDVWGGVMCCEGQMVVCVWWDRNQPSMPPCYSDIGCSTADAIIQRCVAEHEKHHIHESRCDPEDPNPHPAIATGDGSECGATCVEKHCIESALASGACNVGNFSDSRDCWRRLAYYYQRYVNDMLKAEGCDCP